MSNNYHGNYGESPLATGLELWWVFRLLDDGEYIILQSLGRPTTAELEEATGLVPFPGVTLAYGPAPKKDAFEFIQDVAPIA